MTSRDISLPATLSQMLPRVDPAFLWTMLVAGGLATLAFDIYGQSISPMLGGARLAPVPLANGVIAALTGAPYGPAAHGLHYIAGLIAYPLGWLLIVRPVWQRVAPSLHWSLPAAAYGVALWVFALFGMAHLIAGMPAFLGFAGITWVALAGHVLFALVVAAVTERRG